ncbi:DUF3426 domain-containing protein [Thalassolituus sp. LLYu03]|uniref:DUF3426 domain-containing protein n=1 Tax=Thalassolituus sp. LLYu03 TaxID=3421656 RepID=UPI003D2E78FE
MAVHVTRCPHCQTSFRVRDEHLSVAKGLVRCGSCLQVFKAADYFVDEQPKATAKPHSVLKGPSKPIITPKPKPAPVSKPKVTDDDDVGLIHDDMDDDPIPDKLVDDPFVDFNLRAPDSKPRPAPRMELELDESVFSIRNASTHSLDFVDPDSDDEEGKAHDDDESWANALLDEDDESGEVKVSTSKLKLSDTSDFNFDLPPPEDDDFRGFIDDEDEDPSERPRNDSFTLGGESLLETEELEITLPPQSVSRLQDEPLRLVKRARESNFPWGWFSASVVMLLIAGAQTLYFHFDEWARSPGWRPWYAKICDISGCQLPRIQNIREMSTQHLVVRPHPELQRALVVDTLLLNKAGYEQPFPDLTLVFRDLNDNIVASRRFKPAQYLSGELAGQTEMPVQTPVHIALEVVDPGPEAVSYAIALESNQ